MKTLLLLNSFALGLNKLSHYSILYTTFTLYSLPAIIGSLYYLLITYTSNFSTSLNLHFGVLATKRQFSLDPVENYRGKWPQDLEYLEYYPLSRFGPTGMRRCGATK